ncbi:MAG: chemoreceptor glutamine deamidase CheD [Burkholderiales bacterium]
MNAALLECEATNHYYDAQFKHEAVKLLPGEFYVCQHDRLLVTVLGSCVAACIRDHANGVGGMNHFMLPEGGNDSVGMPARYGVYAMEVLINQVLKTGGRRDRLEAKVFGGGNVLRGFSGNTVGNRNSDFVQEFLNREGIRVVAQDLLDVYPRKVYFFPATGRALVKKLLRLHNETLLERERDYNARLSSAGGVAGGDVELFG